MLLRVNEQQLLQSLVVGGETAAEIVLQMVHLSLLLGNHLAAAAVLLSFLLVRLLYCCWRGAAAANFGVAAVSLTETPNKTKVSVSFQQQLLLRGV